MAEESSPHYPEQGAYVSANAVTSLLPDGLAAPDARLLFVHAHPDDESTVTGATMGFYAEMGATVDLLTLTRGEMGEVIPEDLRWMEAHNGTRADFGEALGDYRAGELSAACDRLGVATHLFLGQGATAVDGAPQLYRDSGMIWGQDGRAAANPHASADCLTAGHLDDQARAIAALIEQTRPSVVVTYDNGGGYGHPDHVRAHQATVAAVELLIGSDAAPELVWGLEGEIDPLDERPQAVIDGSLAKKREAMAAHRTQVMIVDDFTYQFSNRVSQKISARETYRLLWEKGE